jgi:homoserine dehydrogenase
MKVLRVGLLGFGTVGTGVVKALARNGDLVGARTGVKPVITRIADLDITRDRGVQVPPGVLTTDARGVIADPNVDVIIELIGGTGIAKTLVIETLKSGKPVVTANKALLAKHGAEIFAAAKEGKADIYYEASVAGGIPIIKALREGLAANHIQAIFGILNGTCNYILTRMEREGLPFDTILQDAQRLGYAEADPSLDIDGFDTAHKTTILAALAYGEWFGMDAIHVEGIRGIDLQDIRYAAAAGYRIKLLGIIKLTGADIEMRVHPALIPVKSMMASVGEVFNAIMVRGDVVGDTLFYGRGAGMDATASAVVADLVDVGLNLDFDSTHRVPAFRAHSSYNDVTAMGAITSRYYMRLQVLDRPSVLARVAQILGESGISLASVIQKEQVEASVAVVMTTHKASEAAIRQALALISKLDAIQSPPILIRIEDL